MAKRLVAKATFSVSAADLRAALSQDRDDEAAVLFFLAGAKKEGAMYQGRRAQEAFDAACRILRVDDLGRAKIEEVIA